MSQISLLTDKYPLLYLPAHLARQLWQHAAQSAPQECVGVLGGSKDADAWRVTALYKLGNIAAQPHVQYLAHPGQLWQALRTLQAQGQELVGIYHSHPQGPAFYSPQDQAQAAYDVPYLIADLSSGALVAYWLPEGTAVKMGTP